MTMNRPQRSRRGFTLAESIAALVMMGIAMGLAAPLLLAVSASRGEAERRQVALTIAESLIERAMAVPFAGLDEAKALELAKGAGAESALPGGEATLALTVEEDGSKKVAASVRWAPRKAGATTAPVRLAAWRGDFPSEGPRP